MSRLAISLSLLLLLAGTGCDRLSEALEGGTGEAPVAKDDATTPDATTASKTDATKTDATKTDATKTDATKTDATTASKTDPTKTDAEPNAIETNAAEPEGEPSPAPPPAEFDVLLVRVSELSDPRMASEPSVEAVNKGAWAHYKAGRHAEAAREFARVAARDREWKHAHNLACASAKAGRLDDVRIALAESFARGGEAAKASAKKDSDLAEARKQPWFDALLSGPSPSPSEDGGDGEDGEDGEGPSHPWDDAELPFAEGVPHWASTCPPDAPGDHWCWFELFGNFQYTALALDKPIPLELEVPARPSKQTWTPAKGKISMKDIREALGIQHTTDSYPARALPDLMLNENGPFEEDGVDTKPFFWWPDPNTPILVMLQKQKIGKMRFVGVILARKTDAGWLAANLEVVTAAQDIAGSNMIIESTIAMRADGLELLTLSQQTCCDDDPPDMRRLCRISFENGRLAQACVIDDWRPVFDP